MDGSFDVGFLAGFFRGEHLQPVGLRALVVAGGQAFELGDGDVDVREFSLREAISQPYALAVVLCTSDLGLDLDALLGGTCELEIERPEHGRRVVPGVIERVEYVQTFRRRLHFRLHVVPSVALLRHSRRRRIFQDVSVPEIVEAVFGPVLARFGRSLVKDRLTREYPRREYCVQMDESDLAFAQRILAEEGIWFAFDLDDDAVETIVLLDDVSSCVCVGAPLRADDGRVPPALPVIPERADQASRPSVQYLGRGRSMTPGAYRQRAFDWKSSPTTVLETIALADDEGESTAFGEEDLFAALRLFEDGGDGPHRDATGDLATLASERGESRRLRVRGSANEIGLFPGARFELTHHPHPDLDGTYVVLSTLHHATNAEFTDASASRGYRCEFTVQPELTQIRPALLRRPTVAGPHTAIVVGPAGDEIHTDPHGRVRVRMHWDEDRDVELSTAWLRVAHAWAGSGFGTLFVPRVGMEVVVSFIDGDPDRPLVTGCLYNAENPPPASLPDEKTRSTLRTRSSPGGGGFNELRFEDAAGHEEVFLHAQRNLRETIRACHTTSVGADQQLTVGGDQTARVKGEQSTTVDGRRDHTCMDDNLEIVNGTDENEVHGTKKLLVTEEYLVDVAQRIVFQCGPTRVELTPTGISIQTPLTYQVQVGASTFDMNPAQLVARALGTELHASTASLTLDTKAALRSEVATEAVGAGAQVTLAGSAAMSGSTAKVEGQALAEVSATGVTKVAGTHVAVDAAATAKIEGGVTCQIVGGGATAKLAAGVVDLNG